MFPKEKSEVRSEEPQTRHLAIANGRPAGFTALEPCSEDKKTRALWSVSPVSRTFGRHSTHLAVITFAHQGRFKHGEQRTPPRELRNPSGSHLFEHRKRSTPKVTEMVTTVSQKPIGTSAE